MTQQLRRSNRKRAREETLPELKRDVSHVNEHSMRVLSQANAAVLMRAVYQPTIGSLLRIWRWQSQPRAVCGSVKKNEVCYCGQKCSYMHRREDMDWCPECKYGADCPYISTDKDGFVRNHCPYEGVQPCIPFSASVLRMVCHRRHPGENMYNVAERLFTADGGRRPPFDIFCEQTWTHFRNLMPLATPDEVDRSLMLVWKNQIQPADFAWKSIPDLARLAAHLQIPMSESLLHCPTSDARESLQELIATRLGWSEEERREIPIILE